MVNINCRFRVASRGLVLLCLTGMASLVFAQGTKTMLLEPPVPLLPAKVGAWQAASTPCSDCSPLSGTTEAVLKEDGLSRSSEIAYHRLNAAGTLNIEAYQFGDATGAVSAFTFLRKPDSRLVLSGSGKIGSEMAESGRGDFIFRSGTTVLVADASKAGVSVVSELRTLETMLPKIGGPKAQAPLLPTLLPAKGLDVESVRYALGAVGYQAMGGVLPPQIIGFDKSAEAVTAKYEGRGILTLLLYPTPQIAGNHGRLIADEMNREGSAAGTVKLRREGPLVAMTTGGWSPAEAQKMVEGVHLNDIVSWNKTPPPVFRTELRKTVSLLTSIAIFSGILALAAVILGLFLGFGRAAIRVLQGKPAATEPEFLRIDLSGQSERIHLEGQEASPKG